MKIRNTFIPTIWLTTVHILVYFLPGFLHMGVCVCVCTELCVCEFSQNWDPTALKLT